MVDESSWTSLAGYDGYRKSMMDVDSLWWLMRACACSGISPVDLDGSRKTLEVVLISNMVMGVIGGGGWRTSTCVMVDFI